VARDKIMKARFGVGVGARKDFAAEELAAFVRDVAARLDVDLREATLAALATHERVEEFTRAAKMLNIECRLLKLEEAQQYRRHGLTRSERIEATFGVGSLSEALALAGAGTGARLLAPRAATERLTCAIARAENLFQLKP
jgi:cobalt-precorrin 5A hydrolase